MLLLAALGGLAHLTYWLLTTKLKERAQRREQAASQESRAQAFQQRAEQLGFRKNEARTVERIARRLAPKSPVNLLNSSQGREYLIEVNVTVKRRYLVDADNVDDALVKYKAGQAEIDGLNDEMSDWEEDDETAWVTAVQDTSLAVSDCPHCPMCGSSDLGFVNPPNEGNQEVMFCNNCQKEV